MSSCFLQNKYKCSCCNGWICIDAIVMSCKLVTEQIYIFVGTKSENEFGTKTFQIALNINCAVVLYGVELLGVRGG